MSVSSTCAAVYSMGGEKKEYIAMCVLFVRYTCFARPGITIKRWIQTHSVSYWGLIHASTGRPRRSGPRRATRSRPSTHNSDFKAMRGKLLSFPRSCMKETWLSFCSFFRWCVVNCTDNYGRQCLPPPLPPSLTPHPFSLPSPASFY